MQLCVLPRVRKFVRLYAGRRGKGRSAAGIQGADFGVHVSSRPSAAHNPYPRSQLPPCPVPRAPDGQQLRPRRWKCRVASFHGKVTAR